MRSTRSAIKMADQCINQKSHLFHYWFVLLLEEAPRQDIDKYQSLSISGLIRKPNIQPKSTLSYHNASFPFTRRMPFDTNVTRCAPGGNGLGNYRKRCRLYSVSDAARPAPVNSLRVYSMCAIHSNPSRDFPSTRCLFADATDRQ
jgi:hypothetical protein